MSGTDPRLLGSYLVHDYLVLGTDDEWALLTNAAADDLRENLRSALIMLHTVGLPDGAQPAATVAALAAAMYEHDTTAAGGAAELPDAGSSELLEYELRASAVLRSLSLLMLGAVPQLLRRYEHKAPLDYDALDGPIGL